MGGGGGYVYLHKSASHPADLHYDNPAAFSRLIMTVPVCLNHACWKSCSMHLRLTLLEKMDKVGATDHNIVGGRGKHASPSREINYSIIPYTTEFEGLPMTIFKSAIQPCSVE